MLTSSKPFPKNLDAYHKEVQEVLKAVHNWLNSQEQWRVHSSGSTGVPKAIPLNGAQLAYNAHKGMEFMQIHAEEAGCFPLCLSVMHIGGLMQVVRALIRQGDLLVLPVKKNALAYLPTSCKYSLLSLVPAQLEEAKRTSKGLLWMYSGDLSFHAILIGGAPLAKETEEEIKEIKNKDYLRGGVYHSYGMSETAGHVALRRIDLPSSQYYHALGDAYFRKNEEGCLVVSGSATRNHVIETQDRVNLLDKTRFKWLGRKDAVVNTGGRKLSLDELEPKIQACWQEAVGKGTQGFALGLTDEILGERLVWVVEAPLTEEKRLDFKQVLQQRLPQPYLCPRSVCIVPSFYLTFSGKIDKRATLKNAHKEVPL